MRPILLLLVLMLTACELDQAERPAAPPDPTAERGRWAQKTLASMTLSEKVAQMFMVPVTSDADVMDPEDRQEAVDLVQRFGAGGIVFFSGDPLATAAWSAWLQSQAAVPLFIGLDAEWGAAMRLEGLTEFPRAMTLGAGGDPRITREVGRLTALEARATGVNVIFAPVADVNTESRNPVIGTRSFGDDPLAVGRHAVNFARGVAAAGVLPVAKHFPGHGGATLDSHTARPVIERTQEDFLGLDLTPFRAIIADSTAALMTAHVVHRGHDWEDDEVATLSRRQLTHLLRDSLHYEGLVFTDALNMAAVQQGRSAAEIAVEAVRAGADVLLMSTDPEEARRGVMQAISAQTLTEARIDASVRRILRAKAALDLFQRPVANLDSLVQVIHNPEHNQFALFAARNGLTLLGNDDNLPIEGSGGSVVLATVDYRSYGSDADNPATLLADAIRARTRKTLVHYRVDPREWRLRQPELVETASLADAIVVVDLTGATPVAGWNMQAFYNGVQIAGQRTTIVTMGAPWFIDRLRPGQESFLIGYDASAATTEAVADALFGMIDITGKLPVQISERYPRGSGLEVKRIHPLVGSPEMVGLDRQTLEEIDTIINRAVADSAFPAASVVVGRYDTIVKRTTYGSHTYDREHLLEPGDVFDLASLTKVIATTTAIMLLYEEGRIDLDRPISDYLPAFGEAGKGSVTVRDLLTHTGGLIPFRPFYAQGARGPADVRRRILSDSLAYPPGSESRYSDFGPIVLVWVIEEITGMPFGEFARERIFEPLGMHDTGFRATRTGRYEGAVPTELDTYYRRRLMQGEVHDETAWLLGGTAGHAGLFSTGDDLARFASMMAGGGRIGERRFLKPETIRLFTTRVAPNGPHTRALGWDTKSMTGYSSAGQYFGPHSFGHTGFTGTSLWIDADTGLYVILLTNRVYPSRNNSRHVAVRPAVADRVFEALMSDVDGDPFWKSSE